MTLWNAYVKQYPGEVDPLSLMELLSVAELLAIYENANGRRIVYDIDYSKHWLPKLRKVEYADQPSSIALTIPTAPSSTKGFEQVIQ